MSIVFSTRFRFIGNNFMKKKLEYLNCQIFPQKRWYFKIKTHPRLIPRQIYKRSRKNYRGSFVECNLQNHRMYITYIFDDIAQLPSNILKMWTEPKLILKFSIRQFTFTVQKATKKIKIINEGHKSNSIQVDPEKVSLWEIWFYVSLIYNLKNS